MLNKLEECLKKFDSNVHYGKYTEKKLKELGWNSIIFNRGIIRKKDKGFVQSYEVHLCREEYIPEGLDIEIIRAVEKETKLKLPETDFTYRYIKKPNDDVVEILTLEFTKHTKCL